MIICKQTIFIVKCPFEQRIAKSIATHLTEQPPTTSPPHRDCYSLPFPGDSFLCCQCLVGLQENQIQASLRFWILFGKEVLFLSGVSQKKVKFQRLKSTGLAVEKKHKIVRRPQETLQLAALETTLLGLQDNFMCFFNR